MSSSISEDWDRMLCRIAFLLILLAAPGHIASAQTISPPAFDGERAFELLVAQCEMGTREPGSPGHAQLKAYISSLAAQHGFSVWEQCFAAVSPLTGGEIEICNLVVSVGPPGGKRWWLGAHYDTRPHSDKDPDHALRQTALLGANDGASGVAVLLHLMEVLAANPPAEGVDLIFFDGEDSGRQGDPASYCLGSAALASVCRDFGNPLAVGETRGLIVLDMVGKKNLKVTQEAYSRANAPALCKMIFSRADQLGLTALVAEPGPAVFDDHVPFLQAGIPAVDLIDFAFDQWHTTNDTPEHCSAASLGQIGTLMVDLIYRP